MVIPTDTPLSISSLICKCWASDPDDRPSFAEVLNDIYGIILELAVSDSLAREWWKENFFPRSGLEEEVPWDAFKEKVAATLEASGKGAVCAEYTDKMWSSFRAIVANDTGDRRDPAKVKIDEFGSSVEYLGGFGVGFDVMVSHAWDLTSCRCFTGRQDIADVRENEFYVRFSKTYPGCYTVCFFLPGAVSKKLLLGRDKSNRIVFEEKPASNIQDVIRGVESFGYRPCTTYSPYKWIFCESKYI